MKSSAPARVVGSGIRIRLNGEPRQVPQDCSIAELLARLDLAGKRVAVELNGQIVPRGRQSTAVLTEGDSIEIVQAIGGG